MSQTEPMHPSAAGRPRPFAVIVWIPGRPAEDSIVNIRRFPTADLGVAHALRTSRRGQRWAVVDLTTRRAVATSHKGTIELAAP